MPFITKSGGNGDSGSGTVEFKILDTLESTSTEDGLSANKGRELNLKITSHEALTVFDGDVHGLHVNKSTNNLEYFDKDQNKWIEIKGGSSSIEIVNDFTGGTDKASSAELSKILNENDIEHAKKKASKTELGHVKVDGKTIVINADGVISAVGNGGMFRQELLETTTIGQSKWEIPFDELSYPEDLVLVGYNTTFLSDDMYSIYKNTSDKWEVEIDNVDIDQPIKYNSVFIVMIKLGTSSSGNSVIQKTYKLPLETTAIGQNKWKITLDTFDVNSDEYLIINNTTTLMNGQYSIVEENGDSYIIINDIPSDLPIKYNELEMYIFKDVLNTGQDRISGKIIIPNTISKDRLEEDYSKKTLLRVLGIDFYGNIPNGTNEAFIKVPFECKLLNIDIGSLFINDKDTVIKLIKLDSGSWLEVKTVTLPSGSNAIKEDVVNLNLKENDFIKFEFNNENGSSKDISAQLNVEMI